MIRLFPASAVLEKKSGETCLIAAIEYLRSHHITGKILNFYGFGGYLVLSGQPVFIDGRGDLYERAGVFSDYIHLNEFKFGSLAVLQNYGINACLLETGQPLASAL